MSKITIQDYQKLNDCVCGNIQVLFRNLASFTFFAALPPVDEFYVFCPICEQYVGSFATKKEAISEWNSVNPGEK